MQIKDVTAACGVPSQSIGPWEAGKRTPIPGTLAQVAHVLAPRIGATDEQLVDWIRNG